MSNLEEHLNNAKKQLAKLTAQRAEQERRVKVSPDPEMRRQLEFTKSVEQQTKKDVERFTKELKAYVARRNKELNGK